MTLREWASKMQSEGDSRWRTVARLALDLDNGKLKLVSGPVPKGSRREREEFAIGVVPGIFS